MSDDVNSFLCKKCDMRFPTRYTLVEHKKSADDHYHCRRCDLDFDSKEDLSKVEIPCPITELSLSSLRRQHFAEASFPIRSLENASACALCSQAFLDLVDLQRHVQFRHAHACGICMHDFHAGWVLQVRRHYSQTSERSELCFAAPSFVRTRFVRRPIEFSFSSRISYCRITESPNISKAIELFSYGPVPQQHLMSRVQLHRAISGRIG